jgi:hypothetical protein
MGQRRRRSALEAALRRSRLRGSFPAKQLSLEAVVRSSFPAKQLSLEAVVRSSFPAKQLSSWKPSVAGALPRSGPAKSIAPWKQPLSEQLS